MLIEALTGAADGLRRGLETEREPDAAGEDGVVGEPAPIGGEAALSVVDAANVLGIGRSAVYNLIQSGELPSLHLGRRRLVPAKALLDLLHGAPMPSRMASHCDSKFTARSGRPRDTPHWVPTNYFDEAMAKRYDTVYADLAAPEVVDPAVEFLAGLAGSGPALELGLGTGRLALPLAERGVVVEGIELSPEMIEQFQSKRAAERVRVTQGDFTIARVGEGFRLAYLVRNSIMNLTSQDEQVACFRNVASHLVTGGCFVVEVMVPELRRLPPGETIRAFDATATHLGFEEFDVAGQIAVSHHYWTIDGQVERFCAPFRYVWPSELDLMARLGGMKLRERWSDWTREPFTSESRSHISVWEKVED